MKNYFSILELNDNAGPDEIKQAYRKLAKRYHPDVNKSPDAHEKFIEISEAYDFLINHWPKQSYFTSSHDDYQKTDIYEKFRREAKEKADRQARMRYEKFKKEHEAFQESGLNDLGLLFTMFFRAFSVLLFLILFLTPLLLAIYENWAWIFAVFFMWPFALGLAWYFKDNRKNYFKPGNFYYSFDRLKLMFTDTHESSIPCYYSHGQFANSKPYKLDLFKLKDIKLKTQGYRQHNVNYINQNHSINVPRSRKAFIIHTVNIMIKLICILCGILFIDISSLLWRIIFGFVAGDILSAIILIIFRTKSNVSYIITYGFVLRVIAWLTGISLASRFYVNPLEIVNTDAIYFVIAAIIIFDSFLMQLISMILGKYSSYPIFPQYNEITTKIKEGFIAYNDVPVISVFYPVYKWIFG